MLKFRDILTGKIFKAKKDTTVYISPRKHYQFSKEFIELTGYLHKTFNEVSPSSFQKWLDDFSRDTHPEREMAIWLHMAQTYEKLIKKIPNDLKVRKGIFQSILAMSTGVRPEEIIADENFPNLGLSEKDVFLIYNEYVPKKS